MLQAVKIMQVGMSFVDLVSELERYKRHTPYPQKCQDQKDCNAYVHIKRN